MSGTSQARVPGPVVGTLGVAADLLREAAARKWFLGLGIGITFVLVLLGFSLRLDVVDGAIAASRLFGRVLNNDMRSADVALRPVFAAVTGLIFFGGSVFGVLACADFAPSLLSPGRIEHLLSLPIRRWQLVVGTFLGVEALTLMGALYGSGGVALVLGFKTGVWTLMPVISALLATTAFSSIYAAMLASAFFIRSAATGGALGSILMVLGTVASFRADILPAFEAGWAREGFRAVTLLLPRVASIGRAAVQSAYGETVDMNALGSQLVGLVVFAAASLAVAVWRFEGKDF